MPATSMRTIGLLGGMSCESSAEYYRVVNETVRARLGGHHSARSVMYSLDFADVRDLQAAGRWDDAGALLAGAAKCLEAAGADLLVLCTNLMHKVAPAVEAATSLPLLHIGDATAARVKADGLGTVGLLGAAWTMEEDFLRGRLAGHGLRVLIPGPADRELVDRVIFEELTTGIWTDASQRAYRRVIDGLVAAGAEGVILGCTEIELLVSQADSPVPLYPTARIHAEAAVDAALGAR